MGTTRVVYGTDVHGYFINSHHNTLFEMCVNDHSLDLKESGA